jgi:proline iminopeptidase
MPNATEILFPPLEPNAQGWLEAPGGHHIFYETSGNPQGAPVVFLHGGPGSGCNPSHRRFFDPLFYHIILLDQRGCGRSLPLGSVENNTTWDLVEDLERLRIHLGVHRWMVFGGSWGSTLALAYAASYPQVVTAMILRGIFLCRQSELDWFLQDVRHFFPEAWQQLRAPLLPEECKDVLRAYHQRVFTGDAAAARTWNAFESAIISLCPGPATQAAPDDTLSLARARVQLHYLTHLGFLEQRPLLQQIERFRRIPATIIQGRYDMVCPPLTAHELHQAWPEAEHIVIPDAGHSAMEAGTTAALVAATETFKQHCRPPR